eukprot:CAMPEP_0198136880 /NCGR_PEP_ID=MMETSP1443-20131203/443_1 /TAXON_ID=186043 /ORGANISM="Entomoneis sp., Strain CCMP2396" /LENGTH=269 /DNA_ID=CAMNT_0043798167 /DNA_START=38 /DNA_END=847 /DNA_ORIENTATION=-
MAKLFRLYLVAGLFGLVVAYLPSLQQTTVTPTRGSRNVPYYKKFVVLKSTLQDGDKSANTSPAPKGGDIIKSETFEWPVEIKEFDFSELVKNFESIRKNVLQGTMGTRGEVYVALQAGLVLCILLGTIPFLGKILFAILGPSLLLGGLAVSFFTATRLGQALSPWPVPTDNAKLFTDGFYGLVRHPIYAGLLAACTGLSIITESAVRLALTIALLYLLELKANFEEKALVEKYGVAYQDYQTSVPGKFFPQSVSEALPWNKPKSLPPAK